MNQTEGQILRPEITKRIRAFTREVLDFGAHCKVGDSGLEIHLVGKTKTGELMEMLAPLDYNQEEQPTEYQFLRQLVEELAAECHERGSGHAAQVARIVTRVTIELPALLWLAGGRADAERIISDFTDAER
jgi:hypothetical protein